MSPGLGGLTTKWKALTVVTKDSWGSTTPLGTPVEPTKKINNSVCILCGAV